MSASDLEIAPWSIVPSILKILEIGFPDSLAVSFSRLAMNIFSS